MSILSKELNSPAAKNLQSLFNELSLELGAALECIAGAVPLDQVKVSGIAYDSRAVEPGFAFFSIEGQKQDGNTFINHAIEKGATVVFSEKRSGPYSVPVVIVPDARAALAAFACAFYDNPSKKLRVLGVTGTNGKTTTTHLLEHIFNHAGKKTGLIGTLGARLPGSGNESEYLDVKHTTPQASDLQALFYTMVEKGVSHVAMEVSSHALALSRVAGTTFAGAALTNITQDHLDFHITMENYWRAKRILFESLVEGKDQSKPTAVVNLDDEYAAHFVEVCRGVNLITYGMGKEASVHPLEAAFDFAGTRLTLATPGGDIAFTTRLTGQFNLYNVMAAMAIALGEGLSKEEVAEALRDFPGVSGRFEVVPAKKNGKTFAAPLCIVDYAHTPDGLENVLKAARALVPAQGKLIAVFGCGGDRDSSKRPQMGEIAETLADQVVVTSDNPRSEDPQQIIADILAGIKRLKDVTVESDRADAITMAVKTASDQDVIVVAGKGHETYQILKDRTIDFDDRKEVAKALCARS